MGEVAKQCWDNLVTIHESLVAERALDWPPVERFLLGQLGLSAKLPQRSRAHFDEHLPFSELERHLLPLALQDDACQPYLSNRLDLWVGFGAYAIDDHVAKFPAYLVELTPFLERHPDRVAAQSLAVKLAEHPLY